MNNKVIKYINELLFDNDCVIIPNIGGFVSSYKSAEIHPIKHQFLPPSKRIAFNEKLQLNDGLLISNFANGEGISLNDATTIITQFAQEVSEKLKNKEKVIFDKIGNLFKNQEGRLQFKANVQENYLDDSFGLPEFFVNPILRGTKNTKLRNKFKDRSSMSTEEKKQQEQSKEKKGSGAGVWILGVVALLLSVSAVYLFYIDNGEKVSQLSSLLPFGNNDPVEEEIVVDTTMMEEEVIYDTASYETEESFDEEESTYEESTNDESFEEEEIYVDPRESNNTSDNFLTELTGRYYVIAGAFGVQSNAENLRNELIAAGHNAKVLSPKGKKPLFRVSLEDYDNADEGNTKVTTDNSDFENALWLMKY